MWYELLYLLAGGTVGFLAGAMMANARRSDEQRAAQALIDTVREVVSDYNRTALDDASESRYLSILHSALEEYEAMHLGLPPQQP